MRGRVTVTNTTNGPLDSYRATLAGPDRALGERPVDEAVDGGGRLRPHWSGIADTYGRLGDGELRRRSAEIALLLEQDGVTYNPGTGGRRRPWLLDPVPMVVPGDEWDHLARGVEQRAVLLDLVLSDLYGPRQLLRRGLIPPEMILGDPQFERACDGLELPGPRQLVLSAVDLVRCRDAGWTVLGHRTQAPSGAAFALENRRVISRVFPNLFHASGVQRLARFLRALLTALRNAAPPGVHDPTIVILSPGSLSETAFEHASIAAQLGLPLVQGADLALRDGRVWLRTVARPVPVHVILRRVDSWYCDPLELRADSTLGLPGLVDACRTRSVSVVNTLGSGVLENAGLPGVLPRLARELLGEELALPSAEVFWCGDPAARSHVLANLGSLVVRPLSRSSMEHAHDTTVATVAQIDELRRRIEARPHLWVGQRHVEPSTAPVLGPAGLEARPTVLRTFAVAAGDGYLTMPGGLARTAGPRPDAPIANRAGALAKDVWVLGTAAEPDTDFWLAPADEVVSAAPATAPARAAENLYWLGRYAERAEATIRLLRVVNARRDEFQSAPPGPGPAALSVLLEALTLVTGTLPGFVGDAGKATQAAPEHEILSLVVDETRVGTVANSIGRMNDAIEAVRDQLSVDTWLVVGSLQRELDRLRESGPAADDAITNVLDELLHGLLALAGLAGESMVRDQAWHFMEAGRRLERALQTTTLVSRTLAVERSAPAESLVLESVLSAGESIITYRRRSRSRARLSAVLELLIADSGNPRSVRFQLDALERSLVALAETADTRRADTAVHGARSALVEVQRSAAGLVLTDERGRRPALVAFGDEVRTTLMTVSDTVADTWFTHFVPQRSVVTPVERPGEHR